jgi:choice-of-anchor B domain-containing protein
MKYILTCLCTLFLLFTQAQTYPSSNINLLSVTKPGSTKYSGCWGWYQANKNKEYALVQGTNGYLYFIDITIPAAPVLCDSVKGTPSINREVNTYQNFCYSVSGSAGSGTNHSFQIIDMSNLPNSVQVMYSGNSYFTNAHTIYIDKNNLYCASAGHGTTGTSYIEVYSLASPTAPVLLRALNQDYTLSDGVHDMYVRNDTVFASAMNQGLLVYKFNGTNFVQLGSLSNYPQSGFNHASSLTNDGKTLVFCDEIPNGLAIKIADVTNLNNIVVTALCKPNTHPDFVAHNPYVVGNKWAFVSCYQDGIMLYDITIPSSTVLAGYFDTYPQGGSNTGNYGSISYEGNWGAYPYFPSGNILALDMTNGAFILQLSPTIGIKEQIKINLDVSIIQNPVSEFISFHIQNTENSMYTLQLKDVLGKIILNSKEEFISSCENTVNVSDVPAGVYFLSIDLNDKHFTTKVSVMH